MIRDSFGAPAKTLIDEIDAFKPDVVGLSGVPTIANARAQGVER